MFLMPYPPCTRSGGRPVLACMRGSMYVQLTHRDREIGTCLHLQGMDLVYFPSPPELVRAVSGYMNRSDQRNWTPTRKTMNIWDFKLKKRPSPPRSRKESSGQTRKTARMNTIELFSFRAKKVIHRSSIIIHLGCFYLDRRQLSPSPRTK